MPSINIRKLSYLPAAALILSGSSLLAGPPVSGVSPPAVQSETSSQSSEEASRLLEEVRAIAYDLERDAATLKSYTFSRLHWQTHADQLRLAKEHINALGDRLERLQAIRGTAASWQQEAIESIVPVTAQLAARNGGCDQSSERKPQPSVRSGIHGSSKHDCRSLRSVEAICQHFPGIGEYPGET